MQPGFYMIDVKALLEFIPNHCRSSLEGCFIEVELLL